MMFSSSKLEVTKTCVFWEQNKYGWIPNPKTGRKTFMNEVLPNSKRHELLKMLVNLQSQIQGVGAGGPMLAPFLVVFP